MLNVRDPLNLAQRDPELRARMWFLKKVVRPVCYALIVGPILLLAIVVLVEVINHG